MTEHYTVHMDGGHQYDQDIVNLWHAGSVMHIWTPHAHYANWFHIGEPAELAEFAEPAETRDECKCTKSADI